MDRKKQITILLSVFIMLIAGYIWNTLNEGKKVGVIKLDEVKKSVSINHVNVVKQTDNILAVEVGYYYDGKLEPAPRIGASTIDTTREIIYSTGSQDAQLGENIASFEFKRSLFRSPFDDLVTRGIKVTMFYKNHLIAEKRIKHKYAWGSVDPLIPDGIDNTNIDKIFSNAVELIDSDTATKLRHAKSILDQILLYDAKYVPAYIEMARFQMKTNWGQPGRSQAELLLNTALKMKPDDANSLILIGYVYTHQRRYGEAKAVFDKVNQLETNNLWLHSNLGELFYFQDNIEEAKKHYMRGVTAKRQNNTYDRAKQDAYKKLRALYMQEGNFDATDDLFEREINEFPNALCTYSKYAEHKLLYLGQNKEAIDLAKKGKCGNGNSTNIVISAAYLMRWGFDNSSLNSIHN